MGKFNPSYVGLGEVLRCPEMQAEMRRRAERIKAAAEAMAPVGDAAKGDKHPGQYKASFHVESGSGPSLRGVRAYGRVTNDAPHAAAVEFGNSHSPAQHVLGRALDAAGG
ncbi:MAG: HK97 gp10 family phage protein [Mycobacteriaceae bacterium]